MSETTYKQRLLPVPVVATLEVGGGVASGYESG